MECEKLYFGLERDCFIPQKCQINLDKLVKDDRQDFQKIKVTNLKNLDKVCLKIENILLFKIMYMKINANI